MIACWWGLLRGTIGRSSAICSQISLRSRDLRAICDYGRSNNSNWRAALTDGTTNASALCSCKALEPDECFGTARCVVPPDDHNRQRCIVTAGCVRYSDGRFRRWCIGTARCVHHYRQWGIGPARCVVPSYDFHTFLIDATDECPSIGTARCVA